MPIAMECGWWWFENHDCRTEWTSGHLHEGHTILKPCGILATIENWARAGDIRARLI